MLVHSGSKMFLLGGPEQHHGKLNRSLSLDHNSDTSVHLPHTKPSLRFADALTHNFAILLNKRQNFSIDTKVSDVLPELSFKVRFSVEIVIRI